MPALRKLAGTLMLASSATHLTEWVFFEWSLPLLVATLNGISFLAIGIFLFRPGTRVLWWGAVLPLSAAFLGTANSILQGAVHPITRWHLFVDLIVGAGTRSPPASSWAPPWRRRTRYASSGLSGPTYSVSACAVSSSEASSGHLDHPQ